MKAGRSARSASRTAEMVALIRHQAGFDPYAHHFVAADYRLLGRILERVDPGGGVVDRFTLGITDAIRARHRWLDDLLLRALGDGAEQAVVLGAGFDARAWRFASEIGDRPVFLVDHPATAAARAERGPAESHNVRRVDVDFAVDDFTERLSVAGFRWDRPAVFLWEGVTMYLPRAAVEQTLGRIAERSAAGSRIGFDLVLGRAWGEMPWRERVSRRVLGLMREPVSAGIPEAEVAPLVTGTGLHIRRRIPIREAPGGAMAWPDMLLVEAETLGDSRSAATSR